LLLTWLLSWSLQRRLMLGWPLLGWLLLGWPLLGWVLLGWPLLGWVLLCWSLLCWSLLSRPLLGRSWNPECLRRVWLPRTHGGRPGDRGVGMPRLGLRGRARRGALVGGRPGRPCVWLCAPSTLALRRGPGTGVQAKGREMR
jgi:hypothetical protein